MTHMPNNKHRLIRHNPGEGTWPLTEPSPDEATFNQFIQFAQAMRVAGLALPSIAEVFAPRPESSNP